MGQLHDSILALLAGELNARREWDEPPQLYRLHLTAGVPRLAAVPVPLPLWAAARVPIVLERLADLMAGVAPWARDATVDLHGMAFRHEGWEVLVDEPTSPANRVEARRVDAMSKEHTLHSHPSRVEVRMMYAVDRAQITYQAHQVRGDPQAKADTHITFPGHPEMQMTGSVLQALDYMVESLTGIPQQERIDPDQHPIWKDSH